MSTSTSERSAAGNSGMQGGFSLIELLLGLTLALTLALAVAPLWNALESVAAEEADQTVWTAQGRVARARLERDLRLASAQNCPFPSSTSILQATPSHVILLVRSSEGESPIIVEWELVNGTIMRRWGPCPSARPAAFPHSLFADNKTMLERLDTSSSMFEFYVDSRSATSAAEQDLRLIVGVAVQLVARGTNGGAGPDVTAFSMVGR